jgi:hypothetical protein
MNKSSKANPEMIIVKPTFFSAILIAIGILPQSPPMTMCVYPFIILMYLIID